MYVSMQYAAYVHSCHLLHFKLLHCMYVYVFSFAIEAKFCGANDMLTCTAVADLEI